MLRLLSICPAAPAAGGLAGTRCHSRLRLRCMYNCIVSPRPWRGTSWSGGSGHRLFHRPRDLAKLVDGGDVWQARGARSLICGAPSVLRGYSFLEDTLPADDTWLATSEERRLVLIDGYPVLYRAYYKLTAKIHRGTLKDSHSDGNGDSVLTVFLALSLILRFLDLLPTHVAVVFDFRGTTFRHDLQPSYKAGRSPTPDAVNEAAGYLKAALVSMAIPVLEVPGVEADDVIGTLGVQGVAAGMKVRVASVDTDFFQILSPSLRLLRFLPRGSGTVSFGIEDFKKKFGNLEPSQYADVLALIGDKVDNVPGVRGIGEKTAVKLIAEYGSLENLLQEAEHIPLKRLRDSLIQHKEDATLSKRLACLKLEVPQTMLQCSVQDLVFRPPEDGGRKYMGLLDAMGNYVDHSDSARLKLRSAQIWEALH